MLGSFSTIIFSTKVLPHLPPNFDWRAFGFVSPVKDQGCVNNCYAFALSDLAESFSRRRRNNMSFSAYWISSCYVNKTKISHRGGLLYQVEAIDEYPYPFLSSPQAASILERQSLSLAKATQVPGCYPFTPSPPCLKNPDAMFSLVLKPLKWLPRWRRIWSKIPCDSLDSSELWKRNRIVMKALIDFGPLFILVCGDGIYRSACEKERRMSDCDKAGQIWHSYRRGIMFPLKCPWRKISNTSDEVGSHAVTLIGFDTSNSSTPFWLVKNSWSSAWGEAGYGRIDMNSPCGIGMDGYYAHDLFRTRLP